MTAVCFHCGARLKTATWWAGHRFCGRPCVVAEMHSNTRPKKSRRSKQLALVPK